jgi:ribosomal protein S18 acetylase RimI-like enzyme
MNFAFDQSKSRGFNSLWLGVWEHNTKAISFYKSLGFIPYGEHDFHLGSDRQRDILMRLELN